MDYQSVIQDTCIEYMQILKQQAKLVQKEMAQNIGISECLISKWKNYSRKINPEYYPSLERYFTKKDFEACFLANRDQLLQRFDGIDHEISQKEFWHKLFHGDFRKKIMRRDQRLKMLFQVMKRRMQYKKDDRKISLRKGEDSNLRCSIAVISEEETTNVYWNEQDVLTLESKQRNMIIKKQDIQKLEFGQLFIYQIPTKVSDAQLLELNQYAEIIFEYLEL